MADEPAAKKRRIAWKPDEVKPSLQTDLNIVQFAESRSREILAMSRRCSKVTGNNNAKQQVPRHMRRRAASHNIRRLPRRLRQAALREQARNPPTDSKRPSRKHRRRPSNLVQEYTRRQTNKKWLETHIWHAKRFHMTQRWGFRLALHPNDKGARAAHRAVAKHCLMQDVSFLTCLEIRGNQTDIAERLNRITSREVGLRFGAAVYRKGQREGSIVVYEADMYPYAAIGPVQFLWKPRLQLPGELEESVLWIWVHPAMINTLLRNVLLVLEITPTTTVDVNANKPQLDGNQGPDGNQGTGCNHGPDGNQGTGGDPEAHAEKVDVKNNKEEQKEVERNRSEASERENEKKKKEVGSEKTSVNKPPRISCGPKENDNAEIKRDNTSKGPKSKQQRNKESVEKPSDGDSSEQELSSGDADLPQPPGGLFRGEGVSVRVLSREMCRFRLTGPLSQTVLCDTLQPAEVGDEEGGTEARALQKEQVHVKGTAMNSKQCLDHVSKRKVSEGVSEPRQMKRSCIDDIFGKIVHSVMNGGKEDTKTATKPSIKPPVEPSVKPSVEGVGVPPWWKEYYKGNTAALDRHVRQAAAWRSLSGLLSPTELPPHCVLGLTVTDPRLQLPIKRGKTYPDVRDWNADGDEDGTRWTEDVDMSYSALWEQPIRSQVSRDKISDQKINEMRSKLLVPGSALDLGEHASRIPVLLIQNPGNQAETRADTSHQRSAGTRAPPHGGSTSGAAGRMGLGCGWDLILPARWAMAFWVPLVYRGARVCGLKDAAAQCPVQGVLPFPAFYPDTDASVRLQRDITNASVTKYKRRPPSKRVNYLKYGVAAPFDPPWRQLVANWRHLENKMATDESRDSASGGTEEKFFVLRSTRVLRALNLMCCSRQSLSTAETALIEGVLSDEGHQNALVPVQIEMAAKGAPGTLSMICVPVVEDMKGTEKGEEAWIEPEEPKHKVLKCLVKGKTKEQTRELKMKREETLAEMSRNAVKNIRFGCSRQVAGFVCAGAGDTGFDLTSGKGTGVGFVTLQALKTLVTLRNQSTERSRSSRGASDRVMVLVRNTSSLKYRRAFLRVFLTSVKLC